jgi:hypothetical protein
MCVEIEVDEKLYPAASLIEGFTGTCPSDQTISRLCKTGKLNGRKVLGKWMCRKQDFHDYVNASTSRAIEAPKRDLKPNKTRSEAKRARDLAAATAELEADGIK